MSESNTTLPHPWHTQEDIGGTWYSGWVISWVMTMPFLNTFHIVPVLEMSLLSDVHNSGDNVLLCGDCDVHEEDSTDQKSKDCNNIFQ